jgi:hypothetical protein
MKIPSQQKATVVFVGGLFRKAVQVRSFKNLRWLGSRESAVLSEALHHGKAKLSLTDPTAGDSQRMPAEDYC